MCEFEGSFGDDDLFVDIFRLPFVITFGGMIVNSGSIDEVTKGDCYLKFTFHEFKYDLSLFKYFPLECIMFEISLSSSSNIGTAKRTRKNYRQFYYMLP